MSPVAELAGAKAPIWMWTKPAEVESAALDQLRTIADLPYIHHHVAVMPDVHLGKGATVGSVVAMREAVSPAAVGVDIGCGMAALRTNLTAADLPDDLGALRSAVEAAIPVGHLGHASVASRVRGYDELWSAFGRLHPAVAGRLDRAMAQLGTLGSGNHFIELCLDTDGTVWLMLHSGSRNIGKEIAEAHIRVAKQLDHNVGLPDRDLAVFLAGTPEMTAYRFDLDWAQTYARRNRETMLALYVEALRRFFPRLRVPCPPTAGPHAGDAAFASVNCHHNYVAEEHHYGADVLVTRKGAISAPGGGVRDHSRLDGDAVLRRAGPGEPGVVPVGVARGGPADEPVQGEADLHHRRLRRPDGGGGVPEGRRGARRDPGGLQGRRRGRRLPAGPRRGRRPAPRRPLRQGLSFCVNGELRRRHAVVAVRAARRTSLPGLVTTCRLRFSLRCDRVVSPLGRLRGCTEFGSDAAHRHTVVVRLKNGCPAGACARQHSLLRGGRFFGMTSSCCERIYGTGRSQLLGLFEPLFDRSEPELPVEKSDVPGVGLDPRSKELHGEQVTCRSDVYGECVAFVEANRLGVRSR